MSLNVSGGLSTPFSMIDLKQGDVVTCMVTDIQPSKNEQGLLETIPFGEDWRKYATFSEGVMYKIVAINKGTPTDVGETFVELSSGEPTFPKGKFGFQFFHGINQKSMFGSDGTWDFKFGCTMPKAGKNINVEYSFKALPEGWDKCEPEDRFDYWKKIASLGLAVGRKPILTPAGRGWNLDFDNIHRLDIGDVFTAYVSKASSKKDDKIYTYLKILVKKDDQWLKKKEYDLYEIENASNLAFKINEAINKKSSESEKDDEAFGS